MTLSKTMITGLRAVASGKWVDASDATLRALARRGLVTLVWAVTQERRGPWRYRRTVDRSYVAKCTITDLGVSTFHALEGA